VAQEVVDKVVEKAKEEPAATTMIIELPANIEPEKAKVTPESIIEPEQTKEEDVIEKIVEEKPSAPTEKTTTSEVVEVKKDVQEKEKPPTQS
jgi:hypothetical protein